VLVFNLILNSNFKIKLEFILEIISLLYYLLLNNLEYSFIDVMGHNDPIYIT